ncbi:MAG TPA: hypothetical protein VGP43_01530 [Chitinophagaceae bacterium]|nr:hypothetical protein [Chitinophagaceae bacterium]
MWRHGTNDVAMDVSRHSSFSGSHHLDCKADKEINMENLKAAALIVPVIALIVISILYMHLLKYANNRSVFKRLSYLIITFSFLLNFAWEMAQMPLYEGMKLNMQTAMLCGLASLADTLMVLLLYYAFAVIYKDSFWVQHFAKKRISLLIVVGATGAILAEMLHLSAGSWKYSRSMPKIPFVNVGLIPVLQFMILPACIYYLSFLFLKMKESKYKNYNN